MQMTDEVKADCQFVVKGIETMPLVLKACPRAGKTLKAK